MGIESLSAFEAILIAVSGILTVTIMLGCLSIIIMVISKVVMTLEGKKAPAAPAPVASAPVAPAKDPNATYGGETLLIDVDEKTAACIMAIVSDETGIDLSELVFKKIRAL
ncbi:MAG: OadG family transporter subunit [Clostridia bacterium]